MQATQTEQSDRLIALPEVRGITGMGTTFIYTQIAAGKFPRQIKVGKKASRWQESQVRAWVAEQAANQSSDSSESR